MLVYTNVRHELFPFLTPEKGAPYKSAQSYAFCKGGSKTDPAHTIKLYRVSSSIASHICNLKLDGNEC